MFKVGDKVSKCGGDYTHDGTVVAAFQKVNGEQRYVVENDFNNSLHIFSDKNLEFRPLEFKNIIDFCINENIMVYDNECLGKDTVSERLIALLETTGANLYKSRYISYFYLDNEHLDYFKSKGSLPIFTTKICVGKFLNGKYILGAY